MPPIGISQILPTSQTYQRSEKSVSTYSRDPAVNSQTLLPEPQGQNYSSTVYPHTNQWEVSFALSGLESKHDAYNIQQTEKILHTTSESQRNNHLINQPDSESILCVPWKTKTRKMWEVTRGNKPFIHYNLHIIKEKTE